MALFYETGVASDPTDLLNKLRTFLASHGWTASVPLSGDVVLHKGAIFAGVDATATVWNTRGCLSFDAGLAYNAQPNNSALTHDMNLGAGPFTAYHFFAGDEGGQEYAHVACEISAGLFRHWALGSLVKSGTYTGGVYTDSTYLDTSTNVINSSGSGEHRHICDSANTTKEGAHIWIDYDAKANNWQQLRAYDQTTSTACLGSTRGQSLHIGLIAIGFQQWNLRTILFPMHYFANRASSLRSPIGRIPHMRALNIRNFFPGEIITVGGDDWMVFPVFQKQLTTPGNTVPNSGLYGYAYRR